MSNKISTSELLKTEPFKTMAENVSEFLINSRTARKEADEIHMEDLEAAAEFYDGFEAEFPWDDEQEYDCDNF